VLQKLDTDPWRVRVVVATHAEENSTSAALAIIESAANGWSGRHLSSPVKLFTGLAAR